MQVSVESTGALERRLTVAVEENRIDEAVKDRLKKLSKTVNLKGFRAGKVPMSVVQQRYGEQVRQEVLGEVLQSSFYEAVSQEKLKPAGMPNFDTKPKDPGEGLEYTATFEVYPDVELTAMDSLSIEKPAVEISDADIDNMIETIRKQHISYQEVEREAKEGDRVIIDFEGKIDGVPFDGGKAEDTPLELGKGRMIQGFEEGITGAKPGETRTITVTFPEEYHAKHLAGKPAEFDITVKKVEEAVLPEVDEELARRLGVDDGDLDKMRDEIRNNMQRELDMKVKSNLKTRVMDALMEAHPIDIPQSLIESESHNLAQQMSQNLAQQGMPQEQQLDPAMFADQAKRRVALGLIMSEIVKQNNFEADPAKVREQVEQIAEPYEHPAEVIKWYYADKNRLAEIESLVIEEEVVNWVMKQAQMTDKKMGFDEIMYPTQPQK